MRQSPQSRGFSPFIGFCQRWDAFNRVEAQDQMVHATYHKDSQPVSTGCATRKVKGTHVGYLANDEHISNQLFRLLPSKFTVDNLVSATGGSPSTESPDR